MRGSLGVLLSLGLIFGAGACDTPPPAAGAAGEGKAGEVKAAEGAQPSGEGAAAGAGATQEVGYDACLAACADDPKLSADDRATCRLNCKADDAVDRRKVGGATEDKAATKPLIKELHTCVDACAALTDEAAKAACPGECVDKQAAAESTLRVLKATSPAAAAGDPKALQECAKGCFSTFVSCGGECGKTAAGTDAATCELNCESQAAVCAHNCGGG
ncbi:MAG: hypothetical protein H6710_14525 [Myxococcales bacterium]|nr:hypothetical protein [Myxococcales bacterium]MCB9702110.1 hypothetical protein [Myxococcales bacterium]